MIRTREGERAHMAKAKDHDGAKHGAEHTHEPPFLAPRRSLKHGKRIFDLNLSDRIAGVWDERIPIVQQTVIEGVGISAHILASWPEISKRCDEIITTFQLTVLESHYHFCLLYTSD